MTDDELLAAVRRFDPDAHWLEHRFGGAQLLVSSLAGEALIPRGTLEAMLGDDMLMADLARRASTTRPRASAINRQPS